MSEVKAFCSSCIICGVSILLIPVHLDTFLVPAELRGGVDMLQKLKQGNAHTYFENMKLQILYQ